jgi:hypothetical protein
MSMLPFGNPLLGTTEPCASSILRAVGCTLSSGVEFRRGVISGGIRVEMEAGSCCNRNCGHQRCDLSMVFWPTDLLRASEQKMGRRVPIVKSVPAELRDFSVARAAGREISFMGVAFDVPWDDVDEKKSRVVGSWAFIIFRSGTAIILCIGKPKEFMGFMFQKKYASPEQFTRLYGPNVLNSDYDLKKAIYQTTPSGITLLTPTGQAAGLSSVLIINAIMPPTTDWAIYNIQTTAMRGFQLGDPVRRPKKMSLELYADDVEVEINIEQAASGPTPAITQSEINRIVQSVHTTKNAQPILSFNPREEILSKLNPKS